MKTIRKAYMLAKKKMNDSFTIEIIQSWSKWFLKISSYKVITLHLRHFTQLLSKTILSIWSILRRSLRYHSHAWRFHSFLKPLFSKHSHIMTQSFLFFLRFRWPSIFVSTHSIIQHVFSTLTKPKILTQLFLHYILPFSLKSKSPRQRFLSSSISKFE